MTKLLEEEDNAKEIKGARICKNEIAFSERELLKHSRSRWPFLSLSPLPAKKKKDAQPKISFGVAFCIGSYYSVICLNLKRVSEFQTRESQDDFQSRF